MARKRTLHQFKITLFGIDPTIWRRIQVPSEFSFWELHVAIQDAMGWLDCHLHAFRIVDPETGKPHEIGIPDDEGWTDVPCLAGWDVPIQGLFALPGSKAMYEYDFGDGWTHEVLLEEILPRPARKRFPKCIDGRRACPPEDCGGPGGYERMIDILADPDHEEHEMMKEWLGKPLDPEAFDAKKVRFDDPQGRMDLVFG